MEDSGDLSPQHSRTVVSPATSTPSQSPGELLSTPAVTPMRHTGWDESGNSTMGTSMALDSSNEDLTYEKDEEDTTIITTGLGSCVAGRTRSKDAIRQDISLNMTQITEKINREIQNLEDTREEDMPGQKAMDSINLPKYREMLNTMNNINRSLSIMANLEDRFE